MRFATWNVNSLNPPRHASRSGCGYAQPDVLCMQETKLADSTFPQLTFSSLGYESVHHGPGQWNGVAILSRVGIEKVTSGLRRPRRPVRWRRPAARRDVRRRPLRRRVRAERARGRHRVLRAQARVARVPARVDRRDGDARRAARAPRRLQRRTRGPRRVVDQGVRGRHPRHRARTGAVARSCATGASSTRSARCTTTTASSPTGTTAGATSTSTAGCASTSCYVTRPVAERLALGAGRPQRAQGQAALRPRAAGLRPRRLSAPRPTRRRRRGAGRTGVTARV